MARSVNANNLVHIKGEIIKIKLIIIIIVVVVILIMKTLKLAQVAPNVIEQVKKFVI